MWLMVVQVALLFLCDTLNCAFDITFLYIPLVGNFGMSYASWSWVYAHVHTCRQRYFPDVCDLG